MEHCQRIDASFCTIIHFRSLYLYCNYFLNSHSLRRDMAIPFSSHSNDSMRSQFHPRIINCVTLPRFTGLRVLTEENSLFCLSLSRTSHKQCTRINLRPRTYLPIHWFSRTFCITQQCQQQPIRQTFTRLTKVFDLEFHISL